MTLHGLDVELLIGPDGSVVLRHITGGKVEAQTLLHHLFGELGEESYRTPAIWDWIRIEPEQVPPGRLAAVRALAPITQASYDTPNGPRSITVHIREVERTPDFDVPTVSLVQEMEKPARWRRWIGVVAALAVLVFIVQFRLSRPMGWQDAGLEEVFQALATPSSPVTFMQRLAARDGEHFAVDPSAIPHAIRNGAVFRSGGDAWLAVGIGLGDRLVMLRQSREPLLLDTREGPAGRLRFISAAGTPIAIELIPIRITEPPAGYTEVTGNEPPPPPPLTIGGDVLLRGGIKASGGGFELWCPGFTGTRYHCQLDGPTGEAGEALFRHAAEASLGVGVYGRVEAAGAPASHGYPIRLRPRALQLSREICVSLEP